MSMFATPWAPDRRRYSIPGSLMMKLELGEAPPRIASTMDIRAGHRDPEHRTGLAAVDRVLHRFSDRVSISRAHAAASSMHRPGYRHLDFDETEHCIGLSRTFRVDVDPSCPLGDVVDALRQLHEVATASPSYLCSAPFLLPLPTDDERVDRSRDIVHASEAAAYEPGHPGVSIGVLDTGIAPGRSGFGANVLNGIDTVQLGTGDLAAGFELLGDTTGVDTTPDDEVGHGTACAGIIGGIPGVAPPGLAAGCTLLPVRVLGSVRPPGRAEALGVGSPLDIDLGMKRAIDLGVKVLNLSFGTVLDALDPADPTPHEDIVRYGLARGCVMVAASGNSGKVERYSPAALPGVIAVGAVDDDRAPTHFSTRGAHVALCSPGSRVLGLGRDGGAVRVTGTSFAAPFVTAACALLVSRSLRRAHPLDGEAVRRILVATADAWPPGTDDGFGAGVLNAAAALRALDREIDREMSTEAGIRDGPGPEEMPHP